MLNGQKSGFIPVTSGVPQGSVLGPLLLTIFVNDIPSVVSSPIFMFADDTKIFHFARSVMIMLYFKITWMYSMNGQFIGSWSIISPSVYKHVHFGPVHQFGLYYLNGNKIDSVESQKDLGILFDHQLTYYWCCCKS